MQRLSEMVSVEITEESHDERGAAYASVRVQDAAGRSTWVHPSRIRDGRIQQQFLMSAPEREAILESADRLAPLTPHGPCNHLIPGSAPDEEG